MNTSSQKSPVRSPSARANVAVKSLSAGQVQLSDTALRAVKEMADGLLKRTDNKPHEFRAPRSANFRQF